jgi:hypothetical protein
MEGEGKFWADDGFFKWDFLPNNAARRQRGIHISFPFLFPISLRISHLFDSSTVVVQMAGMYLCSSGMSVSVVLYQYQYHILLQ